MEKNREELNSRFFLIRMKNSEKNSLLKKFKNPKISSNLFLMPLIIRSSFYGRLHIKMNKKKITSQVVGGGKYILIYWKRK
jgi:hypothetical protein